MKSLKPRQLAVWVSLPLAVFLTHNAWAQTNYDSTGKTTETLTSFIQTSLSQQPELLAAQADIRAAQANFRAAGQSLYNPTLELDYENSAETTRSIGLSQTIDWGDRQGGQAAVAQAMLNTVTTNYQLNQQSVIARLLSQLAHNQTQQKLSLLSSNTLALMQEFKQIAQRRHQAGDLNQVDLNLARLAYSQALMEQARFKSNASESYQILQSLAGDLPDQLPTLPDKMPEPELPQDIDSFLMTLPSIKYQLTQVNTAKKRIALAKTKQAWQPTIGFTAGTEGKDNLIGLNLSLPLNVRNNFSAEVDVAQQNMIASDMRAQQAYRDNRASLVSSTHRYQNLLFTWEDWRQNSKDSVEQQLDLVNQLWQAGDLSASEYLLQIKQAIAIQATGVELLNQLWQVAFQWMEQTASANTWLDINLDLQEIQ